MSTLLMHLHGSRELNHTIWPPNLYIYDDLLIYKKRRWLRMNEVTISYSHIVRVDLDKGLFFANLNIVTSADESVLIKFILRAKAAKAKKIIDQKIYGALAKHKVEGDPDIAGSQNYEKSLNRLHELLNRGRISKGEFTRKRADLLKKLR